MHRVSGVGRAVEQGVFAALADLQAVDGAALLGAARLEQLHHIGVLLRQLEGMLVQLVHGVELLIIRHAGQDGFHVKVHWITPSFTRWQATTRPSGRRVSCGYSCLHFSQARGQRSAK